MTDGPATLPELPPSPAAREAVAEAIERNGSIVTSAVFVPPTVTELPSSHYDGAHSQPKLSESQPLVDAETQRAPAPSSPLLESLRTSVARLYDHATRLEEDGEFGRADQVRTLARGLRDEIDMIRREVSPTPRLSLPNSPATSAPSNYEPAPSEASFGASELNPPADAAVLAALDRATAPAGCHFCTRASGGTCKS